MRVWPALTPGRACAGAESHFTESTLVKTHPIIAAAACVALTLAATSHPALAADAPRETLAPAFAHPIVNAPGKTVTALIVSYAPGGKTPAHRHGRAFVVA